MSSNTLNEKLLTSQISNNSDAGHLGFRSIYKQSRPLKRPAFIVNDMTKTFIDLNKSYIYVGDNSRFQQRITWILSFQWIFYSMLVMISPIMFQPPKFECDYYNQNIYVTCQEEGVCGIINSGKGKFRIIDKDQSIASEFDLYCDKAPLVSIAQSIIFAGYFVAGLVSSWFSDRFGRRKSFLMSITIGSIATIGIGFSSNINMVMGLTFLAGFGMNGYETIILVYCSEISERRFRDISVTVLQIMWALSQVLQPTISGLVEEWRLIYIFCIGLPLLLSVALSYRYFCESPRYLASRKRYYEAREVFRFISTRNNRPPYEFHLYEEIDDYNSIVTQLQDKNNAYDPQEANTSYIRPQKTFQDELQRQTNFLDLFKSKRIIIITLIMCYFWFTRYFTYFSLLFSIRSFGDELQKNFQILAIIEVLSALVSIPLKLRLTRKKAIKYSMLMMVIFSFFSAIIEIPPECRYIGSFCIAKEAVILFAIILKFSIVFFIVILMTYTSEAFPTVLRSQGQGICMIVGSIGSSLAPLAQNLEIHPLFFTTILGFLGYLLALLLDENQNMNDFIQENQQQQQQQDIPLQVINPNNNLPQQ
ncbi:hypothetical protein ABPG74_004217 [Tetrahymena malaccensis]